MKEFFSSTNFSSEIWNGQENSQNTRQRILKSVHDCNVRRGRTACLVVSCVWMHYSMFACFFVCANDIEEVERQLLWKPHKEFKGKVGQICNRSCSLVLGFYARVRFFIVQPKVSSETRLSSGAQNCIFMYRVFIQRCKQNQSSPKVQSRSQDWI